MMMMMMGDVDADSWLRVANMSVFIRVNVKFPTLDISRFGYTV